MAKKTDKESKKLSKKGKNNHKNLKSYKKQLWWLAQLGVVVAQW